MEEILEVKHFDQKSFCSLLNCIIERLPPRQLYISSELRPSKNTQLSHFHRIDVVLTGRKSMRFPMDNRIVTKVMNPGDIHYCPPASWKEPIWDHFHSMSSLLFTESMIRITFINYNMSSNYYQDHGAGIFYHTSKPINEAGRHILRALELFDGKSEYLPLSKDLIKILMNLALDAVSEDSKQMLTKKQFTFHKIRNYLSENFHQGVTREQAARIFGLNPSYLSRLFREESGESFHDALLKIRLEYAVFLLKNTDYNIGEITQKCGYSSSTFFSSAFKSCYGMPPGRYRRN